MRRSTCASRASILPSPSRDHSYWPPSPFNKDPKSTWIPIPWEGAHETHSISSTDADSVLSRSVSPPFSLTSTGISAEALCADVAKAVDKGHPDRMCRWIHMTNEAYAQADPKILPSIYSARLISFLFIEVMSFIEVIESKQADYANQLTRLSHVPISDTYRRVCLTINLYQREGDISSVFSKLLVLILGLTATDWAGLVQTAIGKDSEGYRTMWWN